MKTASAAAALMLLLGGSGVGPSAQTPVPLFGRMGKLHLPPPAPLLFYDCAVEDFNGDGRPDITTARGDSVHVYVNQGNAVFTDETASRISPVSTIPLCVAAGDLNGDGSPEIVVAGKYKIVLHVNDGKGNFKNGSSGLPTLPPFPAGVLLLADVDGDGDLDILVAGQYSSHRKNLLLLNDGKGKFTSVSGGEWAGFTYAWKALAADVDGDGDVDILTWLAKPAAQPFLFLNDGKGVFTRDKAGRIPLAVLQVEDLALGDVDGDGDPDMVLGTNTGYLLYENKGNGFFKDTGGRALPPRTAPVSALLLTDLDGDGRPDLAAGGASDSLSLRRKSPPATWAPSWPSRGNSVPPIWTATRTWTCWSWTRGASAFF